MSGLPSIMQRGDMYQILAIDPGYTTGLCLAEASADHFQPLDVREIPWGDRFTVIKAFLDGMFLNQTEPQRTGVVVVERYRLRQGRAYQQAGSEFPSVQVEAIIQTLLWTIKPELLETAFHFQEPVAMARVSILTNHIEMCIGSEHMKDAYKHARYFAVTHGWPF